MDINGGVAESEWYSEISSNQRTGTDLNGRPPPKRAANVHRLTLNRRCARTV